jgi:tRNA(Ile)-lysidine synthase
MDLLEEFRRRLASISLPHGRSLVAVSGGPDSVALLDLLHRTSDLHSLPLVVAHLDHGIHPDSAAVAERVRRLAARLNLPFEGGRLDLGSRAGETRARAARYVWLESLRQRCGAVAVFTAHHADDQIETVLMRMLAGSGPLGLAGMAAVSGTLVRPLLGFRRVELTRYLRLRGLDAWCDPANRDPRHLRSWIRVELLPSIRARLPRVDAALLRGADQAARHRAAWDSLIDVLPLEPRREDGGISVAGAPVNGYDSPLAQNVIRALALRVGCRIGADRAERVRRLVSQGISGSELPLGGGWKAELAFGRLRIVPGTLPYDPGTMRLEGESGERRWAGWCFRWRAEAASKLQRRVGLTAWFRPEPLEIRAWRPGERIRPLAGAGSRLVVRCLQEARIPRSRRAQWPVVAHHDLIVWIPGVCRSDALLPLQGSEAVRVDAANA